MPQQIRIQLLFTEETKYGTYSDAIYFGQLEFNQLKQEDIDKIKNDRINNWITNLENPAPIEVTEDLQVQEDLILKQIDDLTERLVSINNELNLSSVVSLTVETPKI